MEILILNAGSSSLKFSLFQSDNFELLARGVCERIGLDESFINVKANNQNIKHFSPLKNHLDALNLTLTFLTSNETKVINSKDDIDLIGHMFVHGGKLFKPAFADEKIIKYLETAIIYAPVHMPNNLAVLKECVNLFPKTPNMLYFDSNFHSTIPDYAHTYAINKKLTKKFSIRKYGFHGSSHEFMTQKIKEYQPNAKNIVTCHLGNGCSLSAIRNGKCIDTTMGFTPLEGLMMGTRSGSIDPAIIGFLEENTNYSASEIIEILNKESGLKGICGYSDLRDVEENAIKGNKECQLAINMYTYSIIKHIGSLIFALQGLDAIAFAGGVGENSPIVRKAILNSLNFIGVKYDSELNEHINRSPDKIISTNESKTKIYVISTNEELVIAKKLFAIVKKNHKKFS